MKSANWKLKTKTEKHISMLSTHCMLHVAQNKKYCVHKPQCWLADHSVSCICMHRIFTLVAVRMPAPSGGCRRRAGWSDSSTLAATLAFQAFGQGQTKMSHALRHLASTIHSCGIMWDNTPARCQSTSGLSRLARWWVIPRKLMCSWYHFFLATWWRSGKFVRSGDAILIIFDFFFAR